MMDDRSSTKRIVALAGVVLLVGAVLSVVPVTLAQEGGSDAPTPGADGDINCGEFDNREQIEEVYDPNTDEYELDSEDDEDLIPCESVGNPTPVPSSASGQADISTATATETPTETETDTETATTTAEETTETATQDENEPDDTRMNATVISDGDMASGSTPIDSGDPADWYAFNVTEGQTIHVNGTVEGGVIRLYAPSGDFNGSSATNLLDDAGGAPTTPYNLTATAEETGTYYLELSGLETDYDFTLSLSSVESEQPTDGDGADSDDEGAAPDSDIGQNDEDDDGDGHVDEDGEDGNDVPSNDDDDGDGAIDEDDEPDDGDDGSDDFNGEAEDDDDGDGHFDEDDENDGGNSDDEDNDGDGAIDEDDEPDNDD